MTGWLDFYGPKVDVRSADVKEVLDACVGAYVVTFHEGMTMTLTPTGLTRFRRFMWYVSFNPPDLYFPDYWFHEASTENGLVFNRTQHGPRAVTMFADELRRITKEGV